MELTKPIPKIVLEFDELFKKVLESEEQFTDWKNFRNKLMRLARKMEGTDSKSKAKGK